MTEFEIATLTSQYATAFAQVLIGLGQIAVVWYGISRMVKANESRAQAGERQERESERRHAETMAALDMQRQALETLIARTAPGAA